MDKVKISAREEYTWNFALLENNG